MNAAKTLALSLTLSSLALADEVVLMNGASFTGIVREEGDRVVVEVDFGTMTFKKGDVRTIARGGEDLVRAFEEKSRTVAGAKGITELAAWAREKGLGGRANDLYRKVLVLDPDQADARQALGYEKVNGQWLTGDDLLTARGLVKVNGRWLAKDVANRLLEQESRARVEADHAALDARVADQRHSQEMAKIALERERLEGEKNGSIRGRRHSPVRYPLWRSGCREAR